MWAKNWGLFILLQSVRVLKRFTLLGYVLKTFYIQPFRGFLISRDFLASVVPGTQQSVKWLYFQNEYFNYQFIYLEFYEPNLIIMVFHFCSHILYPSSASTKGRLIWRSFSSWTISGKTRDNCAQLLWHETQKKSNGGLKIKCVIKEGINIMSTWTVF